MTDAEAEALLVQLSEHFRQPVLPLSRFCGAVTSWFRAIVANNEDESLKQPGRQTQGERYYQTLRLVERDIRKSNLLYRLIYGGEKLRTVQCPTHKGHWTGDGKCACDGTGWLPEPDDMAKREAPQKVGHWTSADRTEDGQWWRWDRSDGAAVQCHMNGLQLKGWIANGPGDGSQTIRKTPNGPVVMFDSAAKARAAIDEKYPLKES